MSETGIGTWGKAAFLSRGIFHKLDTTKLQQLVSQHIHVFRDSTNKKKVKAEEPLSVKMKEREVKDTKTKVRRELKL